MRKRQRLFVATMAVVLIAALFASCTSSANGKTGSLAQFSEPVKGQQVATIKVKDFGEIQVMLFPEAAPKGVENFVTHAKDGYYDGVTFHRVIKDFMIQGGDPEGTGMGGESIWGEGFAVEYDGTLRNFTGALAYANAGPGTNGSQFFIVHSPAVTAADMSNYVTQMDDGSDTAIKFPDDVQAKYEEVGGAPYLDGAYTVFGQVYQGLDIVQKIMETETGMDDFGMEQSVPVNDVVIETITISEYAG